jgi:hypothetical protein
MNASWCKTFLFSRKTFVEGFVSCSCSFFKIPCSLILRIVHPDREGLEVTDDVSIVEHLKHPVYITEGSYTNMKDLIPTSRYWNLIILNDIYLQMKNRLNHVTR